MADHNDFIRLVAGTLAALLASTAAADVATGAQVAEYRVVFEATWSGTTHPTAYPAGAHFSPIVGATHSGVAHLYEVGGIATNGIEAMAETGSTSQLLAEVAHLISIGDAFSQILGSGIDSPGSTSATFRVSSEMPYTTVVAMVAPSPDWFVGVDSVPLFDQGVWLDNVVYSLPAYDAGSDSGLDFGSADQNTDPKEAIAGFSGPPFAGTPDLGTFTFEFLGVVEACQDGIDNDLDGEADFPCDHDCSSPTDTIEGTDFTAVPALSGLAALTLSGLLAALGYRRA